MSESNVVPIGAATDNNQPKQAAKPICPKCGQIFLPAFWPFNSQKYMYEIISCYNCGVVTGSRIHSEIQPSIVRPQSLIHQ